MLESITESLTPEHSQTVLSVFRVLFYLLITVLLILVARQKNATSKKRQKTLFLFPTLFIVCVAGIIAYQATWQLAGFTRRDFVRFMERYNPRYNNVADKLVRGEIRDCFGNILAQTDATTQSRRIYPYAEATAHVVGFRHPTEGLTGMENAADLIVSGYIENEELDLKKFGQLALKSDHNIGTNLVLSIDANLQTYAYELMAGRKGAVVGIDPRSGAIRILLSSPSFDPNNYKRILNIDPNAPLLNRALHGRYPPGSTFKVAVAGLAIDNNVPEQIYCPANGYRAPRSPRPIRDHEYYAYEKRGLQWPGFGWIGLNKALAKSSNAYFANAGVQAGPGHFNTLAERLAFNSRIPLFTSPIGTVSSQKGNLPHLGAGEQRELAQLCIGQGRMTTTPLHMAMMIAAIANDGTMLQPQIIEGTKPVVRTQLFSTRTAKRIQQAMRYVIETGTGAKANVDGLTVCGKTGTAQNPGGDDHSWFVCFDQQDNPTLALAIVVENAGFGSKAALPIATELLKENYANQTIRAHTQEVTP